MPVLPICPNGSLMTISGTCEGTLTISGKFLETVGTDYLSVLKVPVLREFTFDYKTELEACVLAKLVGFILSKEFDYLSKRD